MYEIDTAQLSGSELTLWLTGSDIFTGRIKMNQKTPNISSIMIIGLAATALLLSTPQRG